MKNSNVYYANGGGDEQYTPYYAVECILPYIQHLRGKIIWCPFDTEDSQFVRILRDDGFDVSYSHISDGRDFFTYEPPEWDVILSNPPYTNKRAFIERADSFGKPWCLFLPVNLLSDGVLNDIFGDMRELTMLVPNKRTRFFNAGRGGMSIIVNPPLKLYTLAETFLRDRSSVSIFPPVLSLASTERRIYEKDI